MNYRLLSLISNSGNKTNVCYTIPFRSMSRNIHQKNPNTYQPILSNYKNVDPMAYIYEKDALKRSQMKDNLKFSRDPERKLPFDKISEQSTKFVMRYRRPGVTGPCNRSKDYITSEPRVEESHWAYDDSQREELVADRKVDVTADKEASSQVSRDDKGRIIDYDISSLMTVKTMELIAMASGRGPYRPDRDLIKQYNHKKIYGKLEEGKEPDVDMGLEFDSPNENHMYKALLSQNYAVTDHEYISLFGSVKPTDKGRLPSYIRDTPIFNSIAARIVGLRYMQNDLNPAEMYDFSNSAAYDARRQDLDKRDENEYEGMTEAEIEKAEKEKEEEINKNLQIGTRWLARAAHAGDYQSAQLLASQSEDRLSEYLGFVEKEDKHPDFLEEGERPREHMPEELRDAVVIFHDDAVKIVMDKVTGKNFSVPDLENSEPLICALHYHEQAVLMSKSPDSLALMAEYVLGLDELVYNCVDDDDLERAMSLVHRKDKLELNMMPEYEMSDNEGQDNDVDHKVDIDETSTQDQNIEVDEDGNKILNLRADNEMELAEHLQNNEDEDNNYEPHAIMGLYLYWFVQPLVRFPELAGDAAVLMAKLCALYEPTAVPRWKALGEQLQGVDMVDRLAAIKAQGPQHIRELHAESEGF